MDTQTNAEILPARLLLFLPFTAFAFCPGLTPGAFLKALEPGFSWPPPACVLTAASFGLNPFSCVFSILPP